MDARTPPGPLQVRNSNGISIEILARTGGAQTIQLGNAPDEKSALREAIERGLEADILVLSGGVSMGKYDLVEQVLADLGAEFHFTGVAIRPGTAGRVRDVPRQAGFRSAGKSGFDDGDVRTVRVCPRSTCCSGAVPRPASSVSREAGDAVHEKGPMTHFLPARIEWEGREARVSQLPWQGSGDIVALASANGFLVVGPEQARNCGRRMGGRAAAPRSAVAVSSTGTLACAPFATQTSRTFMDGIEVPRRKQ